MKAALDEVNAWYVLLLAVAGGLVTFAVTTRERWAKGKTNALMEAAQQAGLASIVAALTASQAREKEAWAQVADARQSREEMQKEVADFREELAEVKARDENCQRDLEALRQQILRLEATHESVQRVMRNRIHDLANRLQAAGVSLGASDFWGTKDTEK